MHAYFAAAPARPHLDEAGHNLLEIVWPRSAYNDEYQMLI